jgi:hypothetical protein
MDYLKNMKISILFMGLLVPVSIFAHGNELHDDAKKNVDLNQTIRIYEEVNKEYIKKVRPIFEKKCFDCHGSTTQYPWYYKVPGIKQMIDYDVKEAKKHLDMSKNFPFISHATPLKDLKSIKEVTEEGDMPPLRYVLGHWDSRLSENEKQRILTWSKASMAFLKVSKNE